MSYLGAAAGAIGGGLSAGFAGTGSYGLQDIVKNPLVQQQINQGVRANKTLNTQNQQSLSDFISTYLNNQKQFESQAGQDIGAMNQFYNGSMASQLATLRAQRAAAVNNAADVAAQQALRAGNQSLLTGQGGGGSYADRLRMGALIPIRTAAALDNANQARSDLGYLTQNQLALAGQRNNLLNTISTYGLMVPQMRNQFFQNNLNNLSGLEGLYSGNNIYGVKYSPSAGELAGQVLSGSLSGAVSGASLGMLGGGGGSTSSSGGGGYGMTWTPSTGGAPLATSTGGYGMPITAPSVSPYASPSGSYGAYGGVGAPFGVASPYSLYNNPAAMNVGNYGQP